VPMGSIRTGFKSKGKAGGWAKNENTPKPRGGVSRPCLDVTAAVTSQTHRENKALDQGGFMEETHLRFRILDKRSS